MNNAVNPGKRIDGAWVADADRLLPTAPPALYGKLYMVPELFHFRSSSQSSSAGHPNSPARRHDAW